MANISKLLLGQPDPATSRALYLQLGRLLENPPNIKQSYGDPATMQWVGRVAVIVGQIAGPSVSAEFEIAQRSIGTMGWSETRFFVPLYRVLAELESQLGSMADTPSFLPAQSVYDAHRIIADVISKAEGEIILVDRYLDDSVLAKFGPSVPDGVDLRLLTTNQNLQKLLPAAQAWKAQHGDTKRVWVNKSTPKQIHDRLIIRDRRETWTLTQSFSNIASESPAEIIQNDSNSKEKIESYVDIWENSESML